MSDPVRQYVVFDELVKNEGDEESEERIHVSFTPNNGHRIQILNADLGRWACFDFDTREEMETIARQLLEIAGRDH